MDRGPIPLNLHAALEPLMAVPSTYTREHQARAAR